MSKLRITLGLMACAAGAALALGLASVGAVPAATAAAAVTPFQIYWTDQGNGTIGGANLDGSNLTPSLISGATRPQQMAVVNDRIYWVIGSTSGQSNGSIGVANPDGSNASHNFISGLNGPTAVTADGNYVYWTNSGADTIGRANLDGSGVNNDFINTTSAPIGITVTGQHIYWTSIAGGSIGEANIDGSDPNPSFMTGVTYPIAVAVSSSHIYWTDGDYGQVGEANLDGSGVNAQFIHSGAGSPTQIAIDSNHLYWIDYRSGNVDEANLDGSGVTKLFSSGATEPEGLAIPVSTGGSTTTSSTQTTSGTSTSPTTTTITTSTTAQTSPTDTLVMCDYFVATQDDICTATVGDASGSGATPTGTVTFSGDRSGTCQLNPVPLSPGVASCSITVTGSQDFLDVTATYGGDQTDGSSSGSTQFISAEQGTSVYNQTIQPFQPNTINATVNNPVAGSTVTGEAQLIDNNPTDCGSPTTAETSRATLGRPRFSAEKSETPILPSVTVTTTVRHAHKGKVVLHLRFNAKNVKKEFKAAKTLTLLIRSTVKPPNGKGTTRVATTVELVTVRYTQDGLTIAKYKPPTSETKPKHRSAHDETGAACYQQLVATFADASPGTATIAYSLNFTLTVPPGSVSPSLNPQAVAILTGNVTENCGPGFRLKWPVYERFTGPVTNNSSPDGLHYTLAGAVAGGQGMVSIFGIIPAPPPASPNLPPCASVGATSGSLNLPQTGVQIGSGQPGSDVPPSGGQSPGN